MRRIQNRLRPQLFDERASAPTEIVEPERDQSMEETSEDIRLPEKPDVPTLEEYLREEAPEVLEEPELT